MPAIEALAFFALLAFAFMLYRWLIHSKWFSRLIGGVKPSPETAEEVLKDLHESEQVAWQRAEDARTASIRERETAVTIKRQVRRKPTPF
jgi:hypothetical protein